MLNLRESYLKSSRYHFIRRRNRFAGRGNNQFCQINSFGIEAPGLSIICHKFVDQIKRFMVFVGVTWLLRSGNRENSRFGD